MMVRRLGSVFFVGALGSMLALSAQGNNLARGSTITQPRESKAGDLDVDGNPARILSDGDHTTAVAWNDGLDGFPAILDMELSEAAPVDMVVLRWEAMPSDYVLEGYQGGTWQTLCSVRDNIVLGPRIKLHMFPSLKTERLRLTINGTVMNDCHGRREKGRRLCGLSEVEIYAEGKLPAYIDHFLSRETPRLAATRESLAKSRTEEQYTPDPSRLKAEIPSWEPIGKRLYKSTPRGKEINEKVRRRRGLLGNCAWAYARTGDERYATKTREVMLTIFDHYEKYQGFRFVGIGWDAVTFQEPAYMMSIMNNVYDRIASSPCMTKQDKLRFIFFSLDNAEFQYRAIRDRFNGRRNWVANSLGEIVRTAYYFEGFPETERWVRIADRKVGECFVPFMADGFWWECSPAHSLYMLRGLCKYAVAKHLLGSPIWRKEHSGKSLEFLIEAIAKVANPFGEQPAVNDSQNAVSLLRFRPALYCIGRGDLLKMMKDSGTPPFVPGLDLRVVKPVTPAYRSVLLPDAGLAVMRDGWERDDGYLLLDFGPHGSNHGHPDKLSIIMVADGHHWIPDAGCAPHYCVFPEQYSWHKQTIAHNTITVDDKSQERCEGKLVLWETDEQVDIVSAEHSKGYPGLVHRRTIVHPRNEYFLIHDSVRIAAHTGETKAFALDWLLHIYGEFASQEKGRLVFKKGDKSLLILSDEIGNEPIKIEKGLCGGLERDKWKGEGYPPKGAPGWRYIPYMRLHKKLTPEDKQQEYFAVLYPFVGKQPDIEIRRVHDKSGRASGIRVSFEDGVDSYVEAAPGHDAETQGPYQCDEVEGDARVVFVREREGRTLYRKTYD